METIAEKLMGTIAEKPGKQTIEIQPETKTSSVAEPISPALTPPKSNFFSLNWQSQQFEKARFGWMAMLITIQSCLGAIACLYVSHDTTAVFSLALGAAVTMGSNALFIALAPPKVCMVGFYISVIVNTSLIFLGLI